MVATRLESRKSLLGADPGFAEQSMQYHENYSPNQNYPDAYTQDYPNGPYAQPSLAQPTYAENSNMVDYDFQQGYAAREGLTSSHAVSTHRDNFGFLKRKWPAAFMAVTGLQAIICLGFEAYVYFSSPPLGALPLFPILPTVSTNKTMPSLVTSLANSS